MMMSHRDPDKARRYISLLDNARCNGNWQEVPELVRKVSKHAPQRKCLILVAQSELEIVSQSSRRPLTSPSTASRSLSQLIPSLLTAIEHENTITEDAFQAQVCLGWVHWALGEPALAISRLPKDHGRIFLAFSEDGREPSGWTRVCAVKGAFIRGASQEKVFGAKEALETFSSILPLLPSISASSLSAEQRLWTERLLARFCVLSSQIISDFGASHTSPVTDLMAFRAWATFWEGRPSQGMTEIDGPRVESGILRRHIWKAYYDILSTILQRGLRYEPPSNALDEKSGQSVATRMLQRAELKRAETTYEGLMLQEIRFPKADEVNVEVEEWVEQVMRNWRLLCGPTWHDQELGEGEQEAAGRNVLDILYRAAMKTFHSTAVLRHLFTVHTYLAEFDVGFKALDTYFDIVTKGRARVKKSGVLESSLDDDETAIRTAAEGISILCRFGSREQAKRARDLGRMLEQWLQQYNPDNSLQSISNGQESAMAVYEKSSERSTVSPTGLAIAYRAIGISQAHWAEMTYEATTRAEIQATALQNLQKSLEPELGASESLETLFALGMLSAKTRDLSTAIRVVKRALSSLPRGSTSLSRHVVSAEREAPIGWDPEQNIILQKRRLIPFWHLLTLLMSAEQDWTTALRSCVAAFEQFGDPSYPLGAEDVSIFKEKFEDATVSSNQRAESNRAGRGPVDDMDLYETHGMVEIKMTQLALMEVLEGPEAAVNAGNELLVLFTRLFKDLDVLVSQKSQKEVIAPPQSSSGTVKSMRGSLFGRSKTLHKKSHKSNTSVDSAIDPGTIRSSDSRHSHDGAAAPTIQVTGEDGEVPKTEAHHRHHHFHHEASTKGQKLQKRSGSLNSKKSFGSFRRKGGSSSTNSVIIPSRDQVGVPEVVEEDKVGVLERTPMGDRIVKDEYQRATNFTAASTSPRALGVAMSQNLPPPASPPGESHHESQNATQPLSRIAHNFHPRQQPPPLSHKHQTPNQDVRLPTISPHSSSIQPGPHFPKARERRHALSLLVKIWLLLAGLYRRADMPEDARGAWDEASTHVQSIEADVATQTSSSSLAFEARDWGCCKSVDELWGDVYTERGNLAQTLAAPQEAIEYYERALFHCIDHPAATVALANLLLDIYTQPTATAPYPTSIGFGPTSTPSSHESPFSNSDPFALDDNDITKNNPGPIPHDPSHTKIPSLSTPALDETTLLAGLAARDRAHGLLSSLTKLGTGWDNSEAWFALARAYEEGGQVDKAKEVLWWCVELEDTRPVRGWECVGLGGFVL